MDPLTILTLALKYGPLVKEIWDEATSNDDAVTRIKTVAAPLASLLESIGATLFPKASPAIHVVGGIVAAFDPSVTKWLQASMNTLLDPSPNLVVDGIYGPKTRAAVEKCQEMWGLKVDGLAGQLTQAAISAALAKLK